MWSATEVALCCLSDELPVAAAAAAAVVDVVVAAVVVVVDAAAAAVVAAVAAAAAVVAAAVAVAAAVVVVLRLQRCLAAAGERLEGSAGQIGCRVKAEGPVGIAFAAGQAEPGPVLAVGLFL